MRGGFTSRSSRPFGVLTPGNYEKVFTAAVKQSAAKSKDPQEFAKSVILAAAKGCAIEVGRSVVEKVLSPNNEYSSQIDEPTIATTQTSVRRNTGVNQITNSKLHNILFQTGKNVTTSVKRMNKQNGTLNIPIVDTDTATTTDVVRKELTMETGFNQKTVFTLGEHYGFWCIEDIFNLYDLSAFKVSKNEVQHAYANTEYLETLLKFSNSNSFLPLKLKIHMCRLIATSVRPRSAFGACFSTNLASVPDVKQMPLQDQQEGLVAHAETLSYVNVSPKSGSFRDSMSGQAHIQIVKSYSKTLGAGDILHFKHRHHTGPGIRLNELIADYSAGSNKSVDSAISYFPIVELMGFPCEVAKANANQVRMTGTSPVNLTIGCKKSIKLGLSSMTNLDHATVTNEGWNSPYGVRVFKSSNTLRSDVADLNRVNFVTAANIVTSGIASGTWKVPILSSDFIQFAGKERGDE